MNISAITVIDLDFNIVGIIKNYNAMIVKRKFQDMSTLELTLQLDTEFLPVLKENNIIYYQQGNLVEGYIITKKEFSRDTKGVETIKIQAKGLLHLLNYRINNENSVFTNNYARNLIVRLLNINIIAPSNTLRKIPSVINATTSNGDIMDYTNSYGRVGDEICKIAQKGNLGVKVLMDLNAKQFKLYTFSTEDKTMTGNPENYILFSREFNNLLDEKYTSDYSDFANTAYVLGEGEGDARVKIEVNPNNSGLNRHELYVDARDLQKGSYTDAQYNQILINRGNEKLKDSSEIKSFESKVDTKKYKYMEQWDLGSIVTIQDKKWNITMDSPIIEIEEAYQNGHVEITPTFEKKVPTIIDKIKGLIKNE